MGKEVTEISMDEESDCVIITAPNGKIDQTSHKPSTVTGGDEAADSQHDANFHEGHAIPSIEKLSIDEDTAERKYDDQKSAASDSANAARQSSSVVARPVVLATEKRSSGGNHTFVSGAATNGDKHHNVDKQSANVDKKSNLMLLSRKPLHPDNIVHAEEEDYCSNASSTTPSGKHLKSKITVAVAPAFRCNERAERRKEFYTKLEEKHLALEAEKQHYEARTKEEQEAALKQLRKNMTFRATPMPSFYLEGPPPKVELKKVPPTRAKSPKLGRRNSCGVSSNPTDGDSCGGVCGRLQRRSLDSCKEPANKLQNSPKNRNPVKAREGTKSFKENSNLHSDKTPVKVIANENSKPRAPNAEAQ